MPDYIFWLVPLLFFAATLMALTWLDRKPLPRRSFASRAVGTETGHFFFLPTTTEAWAEVCRNADRPDGVDARAWSHPLIGEALDDAGPTMRDGKSVLTFVEFARVYESRRRRRLEHCTMIYLERV